MKRILLFVLALAPLLATATPAVVRLGIRQALENNIIKIEATATGHGYHDKSLRLHITNNSGNQLQLTMSQGAIFRPADTTQQDLVLAGDEPLAIAPFADGTIEAQTFCAKSYAHAPVAVQPYKYLKMGSDTLVQLLQYVKVNHLFDYLGQEAVWVITNQHPLESVYDEGRDLASTKLIERLAQLTGQPIPKYHELHPETTAADQPVYNPKPLHIVAKFEQKLDNPAKLTLGVFNGSGEMIEKVFENQSFGAKTGHRFSVDFAAADVEPGTYYIRLKEGDAVLQEVSVTVP